MNFWHSTTKPGHPRGRLGVSVLDEDILSEIFENAILLSERRAHIYQPPLNLSHTCHAWRELVLANGRFWSHLHCFQDIRDLRLAPLWLERSRDTLLDVHVDANHSPRRRDVFDALLRRIMDSQARLKVLSLQTGTSYTPSLLLHDLSNLIDLELECNFPVSVENDGFHWPPSSPFTTKPMLSLPALPDIRHAIAPKLTMLKLTRVSRGDEAQAGILELLQHCPNLVEFTLKTHFPTAIQSVPEMPTVTIQNLEKLFFTSLHYRRFLQHLKTPALRHLRIEASHQATSQVVADDVHGLLRASKCEPSIRSAHFDFAFIEEDQQIQILKALGSLKYLRANFPATNRVYSRMSLHVGQLCPMLEELRITQEPKEGVEAMIEMLTSRFDSSEKFRAVVWCDRMTFSDSAQIRAWNGFQKRVAERRMALIFRPNVSRF